MMQRDVVVSGPDALTDPYNLSTVYYPPTVPQKSIYVLASPPEPEVTVPAKWRTWTYVLGAAVVAQFFWWDNKCPQVLRSGKGYGR